MNKSVLFLFVSCLLSSVFQAKAFEVDFSYATDNVEEYGINKCETYDVAIRLDSSFAGYKVAALKIPFDAETECISSVSVWLTSELKLKSGESQNVNDPDIISMECDIEEKVIKMVFPEPVLIPEEGLYAGYSFTVDSLTSYTKKPVIVSPSSSDGALFIHTSKTYRKWTDLALQKGLASCMTVVLEGDFQDYEVRLIPNGVSRVEINKPFSLSATLENYGLKDVDSIKYRYATCDVSGEGEVVLDNPLPAEFKSSTQCELTLPGIDTEGTVEVEIVIMEINNVNITGSGNTYKFEVCVLPFMPVHRVLMEEYTGTWCGYCVAGYAAMEYLRSKYPDTFIGIAYHNNDPMNILSGSALPNNALGYPYCYLDREFSGNPYQGSAPDGFGIENDFLAYANIDTPAEITVSGEWNESNLEAVAQVRFAENPTSRYAVAFILVEDDMYGTGGRWIQQNHYDGKNADDYIPEMEIFCNGPKQIEGLHYDEVALMSSNIHGIEGSLPEDVEVNEVYSCPFVFENVMVTKNIYRQEVVQDKNKLRVVAALIDTATGKVVNAASSAYVTEGSGVSRVFGNKEVATKYFNLSGVEVTNPHNGVFIQQTIYHNGSVKTKKIKIN